MTPNDAHATDFEIEIQDAFRLEEPDLFVQLINPGKQSGLIPKLRGLSGILAHPPEAAQLPVPLSQLLTELLRLLAFAQIRRSSYQPKLLTFTSLCAMLRRPQLCKDGPIKEWCNFHPGANLSKLRAELVGNLYRCYGRSYNGVWIMFTPGARHPFVPRFGRGHLKLPTPAELRSRYQFSEEAYQNFLADALFAGNTVLVLTRTGQSIATSESLAHALRNAPESASLTVIVLDETYAGPEQQLVRNSLDIMATLGAQSKPSFDVRLHPFSQAWAEIALIGETVLLAAPLESGGLSFTEQHPGDSFFRMFRSQIQEALENSRQLTLP